MCYKDTVLTPEVSKQPLQRNVTNVMSVSERLTTAKICVDTSEFIPVPDPTFVTFVAKHLLSPAS